MRIVLTIEAEVERIHGKFISKDDLAQEIIDQIYDPGQIDVENSSYEVTSWEVNHD